MKEFSQVINLSVIDFYLLEAEDVPITGSTGLVGGNRTGKSCLLDAVQTGLTGANGDYMVYNASAIRKGNRSERTLRDYCLGVVQHDENDKARPSRAAAYTWVALGFRRPDGGLVTGLVHAHASEQRDKVTPKLAVIQGRIVKVVDLVECGDNGQMQPSGFANALDRLRAMAGDGVVVNEVDNSSDYAEALLLALSTGGWHPNAAQYLSAVKRALRFEPVDDMTKFMRENILDAQPIDIDRMRERLAFYREVRAVVKDMRDQVESLEDMTAQYGLAEQAATNARARLAASCSAAVLHWGQTVETRTSAEATAAAAEIAAKKELDLAHDALMGAIRAETEAKSALENNDLERRIKAAEGELATATTTFGVAAAAVGNRAACAKALAAGLDALRDASWATRVVVEALPLLTVDAKGFQSAWDSQDKIRIQAAAQSLHARVETDGKGAMKEAARLKTMASSAVETLHERENKLRSIVRAAKVGQSSISDDATSLIDALSGEGISARPICDLVEIHPDYESWRGAAEAILGPGREALVVNTRRHHDAVAVQRRCDVTIDVLKPNIAQRFADHDQNSLAAVFVTDDPVAAGYINFRLGRVKRVRTEAELVREDSAVTEDLMRATPTSTIRMRPASHFLIGRAGRALAAQKAQDELAGMERKMREANDAYRAIEKMYDAAATLLGQGQGDGVTVLRALDDLRERERVLTEISQSLAALTSQRSDAVKAELERLSAACKGAEAKYRVASAAHGTAINVHGEKKRDLEEAQERLSNAQEDEGRHGLREGDPATGQFSGHMALFEQCSTEQRRLEFIKQYREAAAGEDRKSVEEASQGDQMWSAHFQKFPMASRPELPPQPTWRDRWAAAMGVLTELSGSVLLDKEKEALTAEQQLVEVFKHEFVGRLVEAFGTIKNAFDDLNDEMDGHEFYGECYEFTREREPAYNDIIDLVEKAADPLWDLPLLSTVSDDSAEKRAIESIIKFIDENDEARIRDLRDPKAYWRFNTKITNSVTGVVCSTVSRRMRSGSGGEGQIPQYIAVVAAVIARALSTRRDKGALPLVLFDEAFSQLDVKHTRKILEFMRGLGLQIILAAPDGKVRQIIYGVDTLVNVLREEGSNDVAIIVETVTDELREDMAEDDPCAEGLSAFKAKHAQATPENETGQESAMSPENSAEPIAADG